MTVTLAFVMTFHPYAAHFSNAQMLLDLQQKQIASEFQATAYELKTQQHHAEHHCFSFVLWQTPTFVKLS